MRRMLAFLAVGLLAINVGHTNAPDWTMNATVIEACSCPMFCQCYFNTKPAAHHNHGGAARHYCRFNNVYRINKGHYGDISLDGAKFWVIGDLGGEFDDGEFEWAVLTFDKSTSPEQRKAIQEIATHLFPFRWKSFKTAEGAIDTWKYDKDSAHATLDGGKTAEVKLKRAHGITDEPIVIQNLKYWGASKNDGFLMMPNEVEAYRVGPNAFEYRGTNGFMVTFDISSADVQAAKKGM